ncbi:hypothetical protein JDFnp1_13 [Fusobacterium phage JD-Fnp1]|nr:hypothetical protein JDFnp1_13 [Fusobacterium phage JD-Fnp1]
MELAIISLIVIINLMVFGGATLFVIYMLKSKEMEDKRIENERQFMIEQTRLSIEQTENRRKEEERVRRYLLDKEKQLADIRLREKEIDYGASLDVKKEVYNPLEELIETIVEPFLKFKYTNIEKDSKDFVMEDIIIPRFGPHRENDIKEIYKIIVSDMSPTMRNILGKYLKDENIDVMIDKMIRLYYNRTLDTLTKYKNELALREQAVMSRKDSLFVNGKLNKNARGLSKEAADAIEYYNIKNVKDLVEAQKLMRDEEHADLYINARYENEIRNGFDHGVNILKVDPSQYEDYLRWKFPDNYGLYNR